jgi:parallel beta-helix repeat protein
VSRIKTSKSDFESDGVHLTACTGCRIEHSSASAYSVGFVVTRSHDVRVERNVVRNNRFAGVLVARSEHLTIAQNAVSDHPDGDGIILLDGADHNVVTGNAAFRNGGGVGIQNSLDNLVTRNSLRDNRYVGAYLYGADDNRLEQNAVTANGDGLEGGIHLLSTEEGESSDHNSMTSNLLGSNIGDGLLVDAGQTGTLIERNVATQNSDDGIDVDSAATTLTKNTASRNHDLGIEAVAGVVDGGGNKARANGNPWQCTNVFCK